MTQTFLYILCKNILIFIFGSKLKRCCSTPLLFNATRMRLNYLTNVIFKPIFYLALCYLMTYANIIFNFDLDNKSREKQGDLMLYF